MGTRKFAITQHETDCRHNVLLSEENIIHKGDETCLFLSECNWNWGESQQQLNDHKEEHICDEIRIKVDSYQVWIINIVSSHLPRQIKGKLDRYLYDLI